MSPTRITGGVVKGVWPKFLPCTRNVPMCTRLSLSIARKYTTLKDIWLSEASGNISVGLYGKRDLIIVKDDMNGQ